MAAFSISSLPARYGPSIIATVCCAILLRRSSRSHRARSAGIRNSRQRQQQGLLASGYTSRRQLVRLDPESNTFQPCLSGISAEGLSFAPDGHSIAYVSYPDGALWRSNIDGSGRMQLFGPPPLFLRHHTGRRTGRRLFSSPALREVAGRSTSPRPSKDRRSSSCLPTAERRPIPAGRRMARRSCSRSAKEATRTAPFTSSISQPIRSLRFPDRSSCSLRDGRPTDNPLPR